jgi:SprT-like family
LSLHLTPAMLEAAYELLRVTPPFRNWKLPEADDIEFHVTKFPHRADCGWDGTEFTIRVSLTSHDTLKELLETMAHEMCHMRYPNDRAHHGYLFKRLAAQVCRHHGFNREEF